MRVCLTRCRTSMCQVFEKKHYGFSNLPYADIPKTRKFKRVPKTPESKQGCRQKLKRLPALEGSSGANQQEKKIGDRLLGPNTLSHRSPHSADASDLQGICLVECIARESCCVVHTALKRWEHRLATDAVATQSPK